MKNIGVMPNLSKIEAYEATRKLIPWLKERDCGIYLRRGDANDLEYEELGYEIEEILSQAELIVVLGGDGTLLGIARMVAPAGIPIFGVTLGGLGFLAEVNLSELYSYMPHLLADDYEIEERMMLRAKVIRDEKQIVESIALNEAVITKGAFARIIYLKTFINDFYVATYPADGLIIATPTGSTAYSLSAGGPVINPGVDTIVITPICPHTLYSRSLVISKQDKVKVIIDSDHKGPMLTIDGQEATEISSKDVIYLEKAPYYTKLIKIRDMSFYDVLRTKLKWGEEAHRRSSNWRMENDN
jgi:NAD+ kinase